MTKLLLFKCVHSPPIFKSLHSLWSCYYYYSTKRELVLPVYVSSHISSVCFTSLCTTQSCHHSTETHTYTWISSCRYSEHTLIMYTSAPTTFSGSLKHTYVYICMQTHACISSHTHTETSIDIACSCIFSDTHSAIREPSGESVYKARVIVRSPLKGLPIILVSAGNHLQ